MPRSRRSQARVLALQALCAFDTLADAFEPDLDAFLTDTANHEELGWTEPPAGEVLRFARELALGAWQTRRRSDDLLKKIASGWSLPRMQPVDRNILRLGVFELLQHPETPPPVILNEAVDLARRFGGTESPAFVNGVLDGLRRALEQERAAGDAAPDTSGESAAERNHPDNHPAASATEPEK